MPLTALAQQRLPAGRASFAAARRRPSPIFWQRSARAWAIGSIFPWNPSCWGTVDKNVVPSVTGYRMAVRSGAFRKRAAQHGRAPRASRLSLDP